MAMSTGGPTAPAFQSLKRGVLTVPDVVFTSVATQAPGGAVALNFFFAILLAGARVPPARTGGCGAYGSRGWVARAAVFTAWCALFYGFLLPAEVVVLISQVITNLIN